MHALGSGFNRAEKLPFRLTSLPSVPRACNMRVIGMDPPRRDVSDSKRTADRTTGKGREARKQLFLLFAPVLFGKNQKPVPVISCQSWESVPPLIATTSRRSASLSSTKKEKDHRRKQKRPLLVVIKHRRKKQHIQRTNISTIRYDLGVIVQQQWPQEGYETGFRSFPFFSTQSE